MPLFMSDEEFSRCSGDTAAVSAKADTSIRGLFHQLDTFRAKADAAEQICSGMEQKSLSLAAEFSKLELQVSELLRVFSEVQLLNYQTQSESVENDRETESLRTEVGELLESDKINEKEVISNAEKRASDASLATIQSAVEEVLAVARATKRVTKLERELAEAKEERENVRSRTLFAYASANARASDAEKELSRLQKEMDSIVDKTCRECGSRSELTKCPICKAEITSRLDVFHS